MAKQIKCPKCGRIQPAEMLGGHCRQCLIEVSVKELRAKFKRDSTKSTPHENSPPKSEAES